MGTELALTGASKMVLMDLFAGRNRDTDVENGLMDTAGEGEVGRTERVALTYIHCPVWNR